MNISVFGLGYVGAVTAGCLAHQGHTVIGVDVNAQKVDALNQGQSPIVEPGLEELLGEARLANRLSATQNTGQALAESDISLICVGTPSTGSGSLDLRFVRQVTEEMAAFLRQNSKKHLIVYRSTMWPGSTQSLANDFLTNLPEPPDVFYFPEFLRESTAVDDFLNPSLSVLGTKAAQPPGAGLLNLAGAQALIVDWPAAEMVKYACNAFHATKVTFANEIGRLAKHMGIDSGAVMRILCQDRKLNLSEYYLRPGNPFGGSCLPKDVRALNHAARQRGVSLPLLEHLIPSNEQHLRSLLELIERSQQSEVVILGLSFKRHTDDLRESAMVEVAQILLGRGYKLRIYDPQLNLAKLVGSNKRMIEIKMPHLASWLHEDLAHAVGEKGLLLAAQRCAPLPDLAKIVTPRHHIIDINGWPELRQLSSTYEGFCW